MIAMKSPATARLLWVAALVAGCGGRAPFWDQPAVSVPQTFNLGGAIDLVDSSADRVVRITVGDGQSLTVTSVPVGANILNAVASPDGTRLFVVSGGHRSEIGDDQPDQSPSLTVIGSREAPQRYDLETITDPLAGLAVDSTGRWAVLYPSSASYQPFVSNPNEIVILDLHQPPEAAVPVVRTLMSFGGRPQRFTFTPPLTQLPIGPHPLLIVESDQDLSLLNLDDLSKPEITVPFTNGSDTTLLSPAGITVYAGDADTGAAVGVRLANDDDVVALEFVTNNDAGGNPIGNGFLPTVNLTDVGGVASDIAFVRTDGGLRLAALVPTKSKATLIDPVTSLTQDVALPAPYQSLSLVTSAVGTASGCDGASASGPPADVALLWNGTAVQGQEGVAFWELGQAGCQPYRSIQTVGITDVVADVLDVPSPNTTLKVLATREADAFYVLNLANRTAAPLQTASSGVSLSVSPLGDKVWTYAAGGTSVVGVDLLTKLPSSLLIERPVAGVYEITGTPSGDQPTPDPEIVVLHDQGAVGATVYDAMTLDDGTRRLYSNLLLEGAP